MSGAELASRVAAVPHTLRLVGGAPPLVPPDTRFDFVRGSLQLPEPSLRNRASEGPPGWRWDPGDDDVWHRAPDTGRIWPRRPAALLDVRPGNPHGDVRLLWEPARLQHLVPRAFRGRAGGDPAVAAAVEAEIIHWYDRNPPYTGPHYVSAMECALRLVAVALAFQATRAWASEALEILVPRLLAEHAWLIERRLSLHSSVGNHTVAEGLGLYVAGLVLPELALAERWSPLGRRLLEREVDRQILPDGGGLEQALGYLVFVEEVAHYAAACARTLEHPSPILEAAAERARRFLAAVSPGRGEVPPIGDADGGHALGPGLAPPVVTRGEGREETASSSTRGDGPGESPATVCATSSSLRTFPHTGLSVVRAPTGGRMMTVLLDHGPLGMAPCFGHGHADALQVLVHDGKGWVTTELGCSTYADEPRRRLERSPEGHSTVTLSGGEGGPVPSGPFLWDRPYHGRLRRFREMEGVGVLLEADHDAFVESHGVRLVRRVLVGRGWVAVLDESEGGDPMAALTVRWIVGTGRDASAFRILTGPEARPARLTTRTVEISTGYGRPRGSGVELTATTTAVGAPLLSLIPVHAPCPEPGLLRRWLADPAP